MMLALPSLAVLAACSEVRSHIEVNRASGLYEEGRYAEAAESYRKAIRILPDSGPARVGLANALWQLGETNRCIETYEEAVRLAPQYAPGFYGLAYYYGELGRPEDALRTLKELAAIQPNDARVYGEIGLVLVHEERYEEALAAFGHAVRLNANILRDVPRFRAAHEQAEAHNKSRVSRDDASR
jgi:tetratricopeptide (TPR) repeat protein